jgi:hypothetical protein
MFEAKVFLFVNVYSLPLRSFNLAKHILTSEIMFK